METRETKKSMSSRFRICWIINRMPVSVGEPHGVSFHSISILIAVPAIVSMGSVLDIENGVTKTGLAVCWVLWLWIRHAAGQRGNVIFNHGSKLEDTYLGIWVLLFNLLTLLLSLQDSLHRRWWCKLGQFDLLPEHTFRLLCCMQCSICVPAETANHWLRTEDVPEFYLDNDFTFKSRVWGFFLIDNKNHKSLLNNLIVRRISG